MNILRKLRKAITSYLGGCWATWKSTGTPASARPVADRLRNTNTTPLCAYCGEKWPRHKGGLGDVPEVLAAKIKAHVIQCPSNPLVQKLEAAADTLLLIECLTSEQAKFSMFINRIHGAAQDAWRASQE